MQLYKNWLNENMTKLKKIMCDEIESHARYALHKYNAISEITIQHVV